MTLLDEPENKFDFPFSGFDFGSFSVLKPYFPMYMMTFLTVLPKIFSLLQFLLYSHIPQNKSTFFSVFPYSEENRIFQFCNLVAILSSIGFCVKNANFLEYLLS